MSNDQAKREESSVDGALAGTIHGEQDDGEVGGVSGFLDRSDIGLVVLDEELRVADLNGTVEELSEIAADPIGAGLGSLHPGIGAETLEAVRDAKRTGEVVEQETNLGEDGWFELRAVPMPAGVAVQLRDVSDQVALRQELERSEQVLETLDDGVYTLDEAFVITSVNEAVTSMTGYSREELVGSHASLLAGDETLSMADAIIRQLREEESDVGLIQSSIRTANDESLPIETRFSTVEFEDGSQQRVGVLRDARDRRRHERTLEALNRSARELLRAEDDRSMCETVVDVAATVWPEATVVAYLLDESNAALEPVAATDAAPGARGPGTTEWAAFATGDHEVDLSGGEDATDGASFRQPADDAAGGAPGFGPEDEEVEPSGRVLEASGGDETTSDRTLYATLEQYGLLAIEIPADQLSPDVTESVELLAANAVAALGRVEREAELSDRRAALAERTERLERLHEFNDLLRRINGALVDAETLEGIAMAVCDHLADADPVAFAWIGESYRTGDDLRPVARAGEDDGYLDELDVLAGERPTASDAGSPAARALGSDEPIVVSDVPAKLRDEQWRERALARGYRSVVAVPLTYNDIEYGVLAVYADRPDAFEGTLGELLAELGTTVANAINGVETKRSLRSEAVVELDLRVENANALLARLSGTLGEPVRIEGVLPRSDGQSVLYLTTDADPTSLTTDIVAVEEVRPLRDSADATAEVTVAESTITGGLADFGANVDELVADPEGIDVTVTLPRSADVRSLVESLDDRYGSTELRARRERSATERTADLSSAVDDRLTDRQLEAVRTAYLSGYFSWPRASTGEEVAEALDITQPTFNRHLRTTERKLFSLLFENAEP